MDKFILFLSLLWSFLFVVVKAQPKVLLVSFDGFRWNYLDRTNTPHFDELIHNGIKAKWMENVFVTQTFPNHYTIATGVYEESHGIVSNQFWDPKLNRSFNYLKKNSKDPIFWGAEPIWVTNQKQQHASGVYFWVGSEVKIKGMYPTIYKSYDSKVDWFKRVDTVVGWLANDEVNGENLDINLAMLYFNQPDHFGHKYGPESDEVTEQIKRCDNITGYLIKKLTERGIYDEVNIIITSDHGMTSISNDRKVVLGSVLDWAKVQHYVNIGIATEVWPQAGFEDEVFNNLTNLGNHVNVWNKENIPKKFHYRNNVRIPPILVSAKDGWFIVKEKTDNVTLKGTHGYDNSLMNMHPFFIAKGPVFKKDYLSEPFSNVNIYPLICHILKIEPAPNNGSLSNVYHLLAESSSTELTIVYVVLGFLGVILICAVILIYRRRRSYARSNILIHNEYLG